MKKLIAFMAIFGLLNFGMSLVVSAQEDPAATTEAVAATPAADQPAAVEATPAATTEVAAAGEEPVGIHKALKTKFIEGGAVWMTPIILCLVLGLAIAIERVIYLNLSSTNTKKLLAKIEDAFESNGIEGALEVCRDTKGPVASIFYQGLTRYDEGVDVVEKSVVSYGGVQTGLMETGLTWISLFIALAPMLGFLGTVVGMIGAFDAIQQAGDISPTLVAGGIKVALITTVGGLIVAIILQLFYNYLLSKIDSLVNEMEDASISLLDVVVKFNRKH